MPETATWYCTKCSLFNDDALISCESCHRLRGSARSHQDRSDEKILYWICVAQPSGHKPDPHPSGSTGRLW